MQHICSILGHVTGTVGEHESADESGSDAASLHLGQPHESCSQSNKQMAQGDVRM